LGGLGLSIEKSERMGVVRHLKPDGVGLKFIAIRDEDRPRLTALMMRIRNLSRLQTKS
jgi:hypothetical protein